MNLLTIEIDGAVHKNATDLPVFHGRSGLQPGIDPSSNKSMLEAADEQQIDATKRLLVEATANLMLAIESATLAPQAPLPPNEADPAKTLREELYAEDFRANDRHATHPSKSPVQQVKT